MSRHRAASETSIEELVRDWQDKLDLLHWRIDIAFEDLDNAYGEARPEEHYDQTTLVFNLEALLNKNSLYVEATVVHELLHLHTRDLERLPEQWKPVVHPDVAGQLDDRFRHELEGVIDRMAWAIVNLKHTTHERS